MKLISLVLAAVGAATLLSGCRSYYEISESIPTDIKVDDGEKPLAVVSVDNVSYQFLSFLPFCSGETPDAIGDDLYAHAGGIKFFTDKATVDGNLRTIKAAAKKLGSNRISNIYSVTEDTGLWSLYLFNRHTVRTSCVVLEPAKE